jgi:hypothetical protein
MKKGLISLFALVVVVCCGTVGCSNREIDPAKVRAAFQNEPDNVKSQLEQGLTAIEAGNYAAALKPLELIALKVKLPPPENNILLDTISKAQAKAAGGK